MIASDVEYSSEPTRRVVDVIALTVDDLYIEPAGALLASISASTKALPPVRIVDCGLNRASEGYLRRIAKAFEVDLEIVPLGGFRKDVDRLPVRDYFTTATWARLFLPSLLCEYNYCLYLDSDLIATAGIEPLLTKDYLTRFPVAAVRDPFIATFGSPVSGLGFLGDRAWRKLEYFNAGVVIMNLSWMRKVGSVDAIELLLQSLGGRPSCQDQDVLNLYFAGRWEPLGAVWNVVPVSLALEWEGWRYLCRAQVRRCDCDKYLARARIIHYASSLKPWKAGYPSGQAGEAYLRAATLARQIG
jgi:lipopolysaccharide biosynthesis glycosyltransferase